jgi:hypothetical protein
MKRKKEQPLFTSVSKKKKPKEIVQFKTYLLSGRETNLERGHPLLREPDS